MARDTSFDTLTFDLLARMALIQRNMPNVAAAYEHIGLQPTPPYPVFFNYVANYAVDYSQGKPHRIDTITVNTRIIGGSMGSDYQFRQEDAVNQLLTAYINELDYRAALESPLDGSAFRYLAPNFPIRVVNVGRMGGFSYGGSDQQGTLIGIEVSIAVSFLLIMRRIG